MQFASLMVLLLSVRNDNTIKSRCVVVLLLWVYKSFNNYLTILLNNHRIVNLLTSPALNYAVFAFASPSGKIILLTKKNTTMEMPPFNTVVPIL